LIRGWVGLLGLVLLLHFGSFEIVALGWQALGVRAEPIMQAPAFSHSLSEFWGKRWNLGFRQLSYEFVFRPLHALVGVWAATLLVFLVSGLIHESVISVPARGGYGLPTGYFILQGLGVLIERSPAGRALGLGGGIRGWTFMAVTTAAPAFWLFHPPFVLRVMLPFMEAIRAL
jgi:Membrane bound O-acyl transferase family